MPLWTKQGALATTRKVIRPLSLDNMVKTSLDFFVRRCKT